MSTPNNENPLDLGADYFITECGRFREIMCSRERKIEEKDAALRALSFLYFNLPAAAEREVQIFRGLFREWEMRRGMELAAELRRITG